MRLRLVWIDETTLLRAFVNTIDRPATRIIVRLIEGIPADAQVWRVLYDGARGAFGLVLRHPTFADVPAGTEPPVIVGALSDTEIEIPLNAQQRALIDNAR